MKLRYLWAFCFLGACASSVSQEPPVDPGMLMDASTDAPVDAPPDAAADAGSTVIGHPCTLDSECGSDFRCQPTAPGGYCTLFCSSNAECPSGTVCSPVPFSRIAGICMKSCTTNAECRMGYSCYVVSLFPGQPNSPNSNTPVCWDDPDAGP